MGVEGETAGVWRSFASACTPTKLGGSGRQGTQCTSVIETRSLWSIDLVKRSDVGGEEDIMYGEVAASSLGT